MLVVAICCEKGYNHTMITSLKLIFAITVDSIKSFHRLFVINKVTLTKKTSLGDITTFSFKSDKKIKYQSGQYGIWVLPRWIWGKPGRLFTIASPAGDDEIQLSTRISKTDFKQKLSQLETGQSMYIIGPIGEFTVPQPPPKRIVLVAGGIGITPMRAIAKDLSMKRADTKITLIHSGDGEYLYQEEMKQYCTTAHFVTRDTFAQTCEAVVEKAGKEAIYYTSGPPGFVLAAEKTLTERGVTTIKKDGFLGY